MIADIVRLTLPTIYPITDTGISGMSHRDQVKQLIEGGATLIQLRDKRASPREFFQDAREALNIAHSAGIKLIINDRVDIALAIGADGVHLGQTDMPVEAARRLLGDHAIIGFSTHNLNQVEEAARLPIDYLAFGPIFPTATKENPDPIVGLTGLAQIKNLAGSLPLVAIGGIGAHAIREVLMSGADSVAIISAVLNRAHPIAENLRNLQSLAILA
ncbi:MAG TPA: thiamine phosphate synthase [Pyrinomonadaceae bacterium]|nr:thiamine phosphate synthase [Pyrinomonadaceae bacterium]